MGNYLQYGSLLIPGIAVSMMLATFALLGLEPQGALLLAGAAGSFLVYHTERVLTGGPEDAVNQPERLRWLQEHPGYVRVSALVAAGCIGAAVWWLRPMTVLAGALIGGVGLVYGLPVFPRQGRLKAVWFLKPLLIAGAWSAGVVALPAIEAGVIGGAGGAIETGVFGRDSVDLLLLILALYRFLYIVPNAIVGDWLDRQGDAGVGLRTLATMLPPRRARQLALMSLLAALCFGCTSLLMGWLPALLWVDMAGPLLMLVVLLRVGAGPARARFVYDALFMWPLLTYLVGLAAS